MIAFADADISRPKLPAIPRAFRPRIFDKADYLFADGAIYFIFLLAGFIREALLLGHR